MVYSIYQSEIEQLDVQIAKLRRKSNAYLLAKLLFFGASAFFVYLAIKNFTFLNLAGACSCLNPDLHCYLPVHFLQLIYLLAYWTAVVRNSVMG